MADSACQSAHATFVFLVIMNPGRAAKNHTISSRLEGAPYIGIAAHA